MTLPNKTITIAWTNGAPRFNPPPGVTFLKFGDTVTLQLTGVPSGQGSIDEVTIFANRVVDGVDTKGSELCGWSRGGTDDCDMYGIAAVSETVVRIVDQEQPTQNTKYWFSASGTRPSAWSLDPELVNEPGGPGPG
jgi:hypothetical protein